MRRTITAAAAASIIAVAAAAWAAPAPILVPDPANPPAKPTVGDDNVHGKYLRVATKGTGGDVVHWSTYPKVALVCTPAGGTCRPAAPT